MRFESLGCSAWRGIGLGRPAGALAASAPAAAENAATPLATTAGASTPAAAAPASIDRRESVGRLCSAISLDLRSEGTGEERLGLQPLGFLCGGATEHGSGTRW